MTTLETCENQFFKQLDVIVAREEQLARDNPSKRFVRDFSEIRDARASGAWRGSTYSQIWQRRCRLVDLHELVFGRGEYEWSLIGHDNAFCYEVRAFRKATDAYLFELEQAAALAPDDGSRPKPPAAEAPPPALEPEPAIDDELEQRFLDTLRQVKVQQPVPLMVAVEFLKTGVKSGAWRQMRLLEKAHRLKILMRYLPPVPRGVSKGDWTILEKLAEDGGKLLSHLNDLVRR